MPRVGRVVLPNYPHHVVQRGHNRQVVFAANRDYEYYLEMLSEYRDVNGTVRNIKPRRLTRELERGACRLPGCDFDNISMPGESCDNTDMLPASSGVDDPDGDGFCDVPGSPPTIPSDSAIDLTPLCTNPY